MRCEQGWEPVAKQVIVPEQGRSNTFILLHRHSVKMTPSDLLLPGQIWASLSPHWRSFFCQWEQTAQRHSAGLWSAHSEMGLPWHSAPPMRLSDLRGTGSGKLWRRLGSRDGEWIHGNSVLWTQLGSHNYELTVIATPHKTPAQPQTKSQQGVREQTWEPSTSRGATGLG